VSEELGLAATFDKLRTLKDRKPAYTIAQANVKGYCDFLAGDGQRYRLTSDKGRKFTVRKLP